MKTPHDLTIVIHLLEPDDEHAEKEANAWAVRTAEARNLKLTGIMSCIEGPAPTNPDYTMYEFVFLAVDPEEVAA